MRSPGATRVIRAPRAEVYRALLDAAAVAQWRAPDGMTARVDEWDAVVGGGFRVTLTYDDPARAGKSAPGSDTYRGTFIELVTDTRVAETVTFETDDPSFEGAMNVTTTLREVASGTEVSIDFDGLPGGVSPEDNAVGTSMALSNLAQLVEGGWHRAGRQPMQG